MERYWQFGLPKTARRHHENRRQAWRDAPKPPYEAGAASGGNSRGNTTIVGSIDLREAAARLHDFALDLWPRPPAVLAFGPVACVAAGYAR